MGEARFLDPRTGVSVQLTQDILGGGNGLAWRDAVTHNYHGTIHGGESNIVLWAELDGAHLDSATPGTFLGTNLVIYRTSYVCGQYWTWEWRPTDVGWYDKFTQDYPIAVPDYLYYGYTSMGVGTWNFYLAHKDTDPALPLPHAGGTLNTLFGDLQDMYLLDTVNDVVMQIHWHQVYAAMGDKNFIETRSTSHIVKYYPRRPALVVGEVREYERDIIVTGRPAFKDKLVLLHDYRSGHDSNLLGYSARDGVPSGTQGRFRTGVGFETSHDFAGGGADQSLGYIRVVDDPVFYPPWDGLSLIASYLQSGDVPDCQIIGQGSNVAANISWQLKRTPTHVQLVVSDGVAISTFSLAAAAAQGQVETVIVRYNGGIAGTNCTIKRLTPSIVTGSGTIDRIPQDIADPVSVGCYSNSSDAPFYGTLRYVAVMRGGQIESDMEDLVDYLENIAWPTSLSLCDGSGSIADRSVQYMSKFGVDESVAPEVGVIGSQLSNSEWVFDNAAKDPAGTSWSVRGQRIRNTAAAGVPGDISKELLCVSPGTLWLSQKYFDGVLPALAAYGAWDFHVLFAAGTTMDTYVVHQISGVVDIGYCVRVTSAAIKLVRIDAAGDVDLITCAWAIGDTLLRIRVTRGTDNTWRLFYKTGLADSWHDAGAAVDATYITSDGLFLDYDEDDALLLGNSGSDWSLFKWRGAVNPL
jgi:hypothetical protein